MEQINDYVISQNKADLLTLKGATLQELYTENGGAFNLFAQDSESGVYYNDGTEPARTQVEYKLATKSVSIEEIIEKM